ncbi:c-type cytochrome biogenesis protein CcmI [Marinobacter xestospongiae]|uniref:C-type cytochrome biogenesis protein CcmI n=1 Tax=Marinobacter xestospongiae TaxID=994319 RepID=A0ABU3VTJ2_9GAMM|nr:c-type cytochrome biogenesis protein CcmI [Marinobacter xestospongiae]MDV2077583.1 c-type cytochrome biogenesis protein CcmI [Marinobacter xestospongiae]
MTTTFWLTAAVLIALALAFVLFPLFFHKSTRKSVGDQRSQNLQAYRSRLEELEAEYAAGSLEQDDYQQLKDELEGSLLDDVSTAPTHSAAQRDRRTSAVAVVLGSIVVVPVAVILLYQEWGAMDQVEQYRTMTAMATEEGDRVAQMNRLTDELRQKLEASPDNPDGWAMLGRSYMRVERYPDAAWAFERLAQQVPDRAAQAVAWGLSAQALFFDSKGQLTDAVERAIEQARSRDPDEVNALGLLGIHAYSQEQYQQAIDYWERIVTVAPDHPQLASIRQGIDEAYRQLGQDNPATAQSSGPGVTVRVALADQLANDVPADTTLFVFARKTGADNAMPVAIARLTAADLPLELRLDDRHAMGPMTRISEVGEVQVTARLSPSGNAVPQPGDWQGEAEAVIAVTAEASEPASIVIDHQLGE